jgi:hypothetical protein
MPKTNGVVPELKEPLARSSPLVAGKLPQRFGQSEMFKKSSHRMIRFNEPAMLATANYPRGARGQ